MTPAMSLSLALRFVQTLPVRVLLLRLLYDLFHLLLDKKLLGFFLGAGVGILG